ncbi:PREDICTED: uncharacterized protein At5g39570-like isoform 4 [Fragaria vesca subsp. vesca]
MPYYSHNREDEVHDFDEYDPTPYGGGYDQALTYGRPLAPSEETCYPSSSAPDDQDDYERPDLSSYREPSAYADEALNNEYSSYERRKPRPGFGGGGRPDHDGGEGGGEYGSRPGRPQYGSAEPQSEYGSRPGRPQYGSEEPQSEFGSGYGRKPEYQAPESDFGSGFGRKPEYQAPESEFGSGYGRKPEYEAPEPEFGSGYGRKPEFEGGPGYGRKPSYGEEESGGSSPPRRPGFGRPGGYGEEETEEKPSYGRSEYQEPPRRPSSYETPETEEYGRPKYGRPGYETPETEEFGRPSYGRGEEQEYRKPKPSYGRGSDDEDSERRHQRRGSDDEDSEHRRGHGGEGYGRKKYVRISDFKCPLQFLRLHNVCVVSVLLCTLVSAFPVLDEFP